MRKKGILTERVEQIASPPRRTSRSGRPRHEDVADDVTLGASRSRCHPTAAPDQTRLGWNVRLRVAKHHDRVAQNDEPDSFSLDIRGLEDRPPLLDLSLVVGRECLRILILARRNFLAEIGEPLAHAGIG